MAKSDKERRAERRAEKLADIKKQVREGRLVIRSMTPEEREAYPPVKVPKKRKRKRRDEE